MTLKMHILCIFLFVACVHAQDTTLVDDMTTPPATNGPTNPPNDPATSMIMDALTSTMKQSMTTKFVENPPTTKMTTKFVENPPTTKMTTKFVENPPTTKMTTKFVENPPTTMKTTANIMTTPARDDCNNKKADIVFLVDANTNEGKDNFKKQLNFLKNLVGNLNIQPDGVRVGLVTYSDDAHLQFNLDEHMDKTELMLAMGFVPYQDGASHTDKGLQYIRENSFLPVSGGRPDAQKIVVVMTNGQSTDSGLTYKESRLLRQNGTIVIAVGIGSGVDQQELNLMASGKNYTLEISGFDALSEAEAGTLLVTCDAINGVNPGNDAFVPCEEKAIDLAIILDTSGSEGITHFREQSAFAADFVSKLDVGPTKVQVGAITFGTDVYRQFFLNQYDDTPSVVAAIKAIQYTGGSTYTQKALQYMRGTLFTDVYGHRLGTPKVVLIMTDGQSTNRAQTLAEADLLRKEGFIVYAVGIGSNLDMTEVQSIASDPKKAYQVRTFDDLQNFLPTLQDDFCQEVDQLPPFIPTVATLESCGQQAADLVFVLDSSSSEGSANFRKQVYFAGNITSKLKVGPNDVQVSLLTFSTSPHNVFYLNRYNNKYDVLDAIARTPYIAGATYTDEALMYVRETTLSTLHGRRLQAQPIVIVLTDGQSSDAAETLAEAQRLQATGAVVIAIGIGSNTGEKELLAIASDPNHKFNVNSFDFLYSIQEQIIKETCEGAGPPPSPHPECGDKPADIVFLMDASSSEGSINFEKMKSFIADFSSQFEVGPGHVQISCVAFSTSVHVEFFLNDTMNRNELLQKITNIRFYGGTTMTDKALETVRTTVLKPEKGARDHAADTVILLTDGRSVVASETQRQAQLLKDQGVQVIGIGVGSSVDTRELEAIATDVQHAFSVINFDALNSIEQELVQTACESCASTEAADILLIIDSSSAESAALFQKEMDFVSNLVNGFAVGPNNMQFSLMTFATTPNVEFWFNTYPDKADILNSLSRVIYTQGDTNTHEALKFARDYSYLPFHGTRPDKSQYVIVITDGTAKDLNGTIAEANLLKQQGKTIMALGIGKNADKAELEAIATDPSHVFIADDTDALQKIHRDITIKTCKSIFDFKASPSSTPAN